MNLADRYPDIQFLLTITPHKKVRLPKRAKRLEKWLEVQDLKQVEILYFIGLIDHHLPEKIVQWLKDRKERVLVFVESRLGAFASFDGSDLLQNPQIHFCYAECDPTEQLAADFPSERVAVYEGESFDALSLKRRSAAYSALYSDVLYSQKIVDNVLHNMARLSDAFDATGKFSGIPVLICGAGPSLEKAIPILKKHPNRVLILAVGSGIAALSKQGITPHLAMALDPNDDEFRHLAQGSYFEGPFLFSPRLHRDVFATSNGPFGYLQSDTGGLIENFLEKELELKQEGSGPDLGSEAFSVTTLALSWASAQGFSDILFAGVDLAYTSGKRYAGELVAKDGKEEAAPTLDEVLIRRDLHGKPCETLVKWIMESDVISAFAKEHPEIRLFNTSLAGLGFEGIPNRPLEEVLTQFPQKDLRAEVHSFVHEKSFVFDIASYHALVEELSQSLDRCGALCGGILKEPIQGKKILLISDLQEEKAYAALLEGIDHALSHLLCRYYPHLDDEAVSNQREEAKVQELKRQVDLFQQIFRGLAKNSTSFVL